MKSSLETLNDLITFGWVRSPDKCGFGSLAAKLLCWAFVFAQACASGSTIGDAKSPWWDLPTDSAMQHAESITDSPHNFQISFNGTVDGVMMRDPFYYAPVHQNWQPNRSILIENLGDTDVVNPLVIVNGKRRWSTLQTMAAEATAGYTTDADKARAIWEMLRRSRFHCTTGDLECYDTVKHLNIYGYGFCDDEAMALQDMFEAVGLTVRCANPIGHSLVEVFYNGGYHILDGDEDSIYLLRDNKTIASEASIVLDHDLVKRTHTYGFGEPDNRPIDEFSASLYVYDGSPRTVDFAGAVGASHTSHTMNLTLRPGESIERRFDHIGKQYTAGVPLLAQDGPYAYQDLRNGKMRYVPNLGSAVAQVGAESTTNAQFATASASIVPVNPAQLATVAWRFTNPYVFVGGKATAQIQMPAGGSAAWLYSSDGTTWQQVATVSGTGNQALIAVFDNLISAPGYPTYDFHLQLQLVGGATAANVSFEHDIQTSLLGVPELEVGTNSIVYTDSNQGGRNIRITQSWLERTTWHPPAAPAQPILPLNGSSVQGSQVSFQWSPSSSPDSSLISDYHVQLSEYADMRWPLSSNFEKLISLTAFAGTTTWTPPAVGLLNGGQTYYWRVRARDSKGVWGPWSNTWSFSTQAPNVPIGVALVPDSGNGFKLQWQPNPTGATPVSYKVYGSNEKGFTVSDTSYQEYQGRGFVRTASDYNNATNLAPVSVPANLIGTVTGTSMRVIGPELTIPNTNCAYYRVVAVDAAGNQSGPSDYAAAVRPYIVNFPSQVSLGVAYSFQPIVITSFGDLRCHLIAGNPYCAAFWDRDYFSFISAFALGRLPAGLMLDPVTGIVSGTPTGGSLDLAIKITDQSGRWIAVPPDPTAVGNTRILNVHNAPYYAVGDGVFDDTLAIQRALNDATALGGATVLIPSGVYRITGMLVVGSNTRISGGGRGATTIRSPAGGYPASTFQGASLNGSVCFVAATDSSVENLTVDNRTNGNGNTGISIVPDGAGNPCARCTVQNCELLGSDFPESLIWNVSGQGIKILNNYCDGGVVSSNPASSQIGILSIGGNDILIKGNSCVNLGSSGISLLSSGGSSLYSLKAVDNYVKGAQIGVICGTISSPGGLNEAAHIQIKNNTIISSWNYGINVTQAPSSTIRDLQISGNSVENAPNGISLTGDPNSVKEDVSVSLNSITNAVASGYGILVYNMANVSLSGNMIRRTTMSFWCYNSSNVLFANNLCDTASQFGLCLGTCQALTIRGNRFANYNSSGGSYFGIRALNLQQSMIAQNEFMTNNDTTSIYVYGAASDQVRIIGNRVLYSTTAAPFINSGTNPNQGQIQPLKGTNRTAVSNTLVNANSRFVVTQIAGSPMTFRADPISGGFELVTSSKASGNETFNYEIQ